MDSKGKRRQSHCAPTAEARSGLSLVAISSARMAAPEFCDDATTRPTIYRVATSITTYSHRRLLGSLSIVFLSSPSRIGPFKQTVRASISHSSTWNVCLGRVARPVLPTPRYLRFAKARPLRPASTSKRSNLPSQSVRAVFPRLSGGLMPSAALRLFSIRTA